MSAGRAEAEPLARLVVATLGHVDHGKTRLVHALTGTNTDRLPDEQRRGISIELGFAELAGEAISFIDVPGHKKLVHTMIAGMGGVDTGLLVVAADDGVMPQTIEHLQIARLSGVARFIVALSKADTVEPELLELAQLEVEAKLAELGLTPLALIPTDVESGRGLEALARQLAQLGRSAPAPTSSQRRDPGRTWLAIDRVFSVRGAGTVVTGTLTRGELCAGGDLWLMGPHGTDSVNVRGLQVHGKAQARVLAPSRVAVNLSRISGAEPRRGQALVADPSETAPRRLDASIHAPASALPDIRSGGSVLCHLGTAHCLARLSWLREPTAALPGFAHLALAEPLPAQAGAGVILRGFRQDKVRGAVLGGGHVLDVAPGRVPRRARQPLAADTSDPNAAIKSARHQPTLAARVALLDAALAGEPSLLVARALDSAAPRPLRGAELERRFGLRPGTTEQLAALKSEARGERHKSRRAAPALLAAGPGLWTTPRSLELLDQQLLYLVTQRQTATAGAPGLPWESAQAALAASGGAVIAKRVLRAAVLSGRLTQISTRLFTPEFAVEFGPQAEAAERLVLDQLSRAGLRGLGEAELSRAVPAEHQPRLRGALAALTRQELALSLSGLWFSQTALGELREAVRRHFAGAAELQIADLKLLAGVSRKQAVPLLEQLDREGLTQRVGSARRAGPRL